MQSHLKSRLPFFIPTLICIHIVIIIISNYLVQIPVTVIGFQSTWGTFTFPLIFLATDLTVRTLGADVARKIIFKVMIPGLILSYILSVVFFQGHFQSFSQLSTFNIFVFRIALASFIAYVIGQLTDIIIFKHLQNSVHWWIAPTFSTVIGTLIDTFVFFSLAFYASNDAFMATHWIEIAWVDYLFKLLVSLLFFIPLYGVIINRIFMKYKYSN